MNKKEFLTKLNTFIFSWELENKFLREDIDTYLESLKRLLEFWDDEDKTAAIAALAWELKHRLEEADK